MVRRSDSRKIGKNSSQPLQWKPTPRSWQRCLRRSLPLSKSGNETCPSDKVHLPAESVPQRLVNNSFGIISSNPMTLEAGPAELRVFLFLMGNRDLKNKCGSGQPPKPHCYRGRSACRLSPWRKIIAQPALRRVLHAFDAHLRLALQGYDSALPSFLEEGSGRPQGPGTSALDMRQISPGDSLSRTTGDAESLSEQNQNISRF
jgi:hypothetical protein